jgi:hypothetical protein
MAHRLLPFRQYDENDVINLFALRCDELSSSLQVMKPGTDGINADGVLVEVESANLDKGVDVNEDARFQHSYNSPVGRNPYPTNHMKVSTPSSSGNAALGVTMRQTLTNDENGESLLFNPVKKDELNAVLSGQTVPVLSKGIVSIHENGFELAGNVYSVGDNLTASQNGKFAPLNGSSKKCGQIIGTGSRGGNKDNNYGGINVDSLSGSYFLVKLDC